MFWIGSDNPDGRSFHGISTPRGGSYNSYLILDDKPALIDAANKPFFSGYLRSLQSAIDPSEIAYIIINHAEPDHTGALTQLLTLCPKAVVVCSEKGKELLVAAYGLSCDFLVVSDGDEISLGKYTLRFIADPMVHWPETIMTYCVEKKALFSGDLFGTEISHEALFADEMQPFDDLTRDYFALVMRPLLHSVKRAIDKAKGLELSFLCPSHGPVYRKDIDKIIQRYEYLSGDPQEDKVLVVYETIWSSNRDMAKKIACGIQDAGFCAEVYRLSESNMVELMAQALTSKGIILGSLTILGGYHPLFETLFCFLKLNCQQAKKAAVFGTYGWSSAAVSKLTKRLEEDLKYDVLEKIDMRFGPKTPEDLNDLYGFGRSFVEKIKADDPARKSDKG